MKALKLHREERLAASLVPLQAHLTDTIAKTREGALVAAFELAGTAFEAKTPEQRDLYKEQLNVALRNVATPRLALWSVLARRRVHPNLARRYPNAFAQRLGDTLRGPAGGAHPVPEPPAAGAGVPGHRLAHRGGVLQGRRQAPGARDPAGRPRRAGGDRLESRLRPGRLRPPPPRDLRARRQPLLRDRRGLRPAAQPHPRAGARRPLRPQPGHRLQPHPVRPRDLRGPPPGREPVRRRARPQGVRPGHLPGDVHRAAGRALRAELGPVLRLPRQGPGQGPVRDPAPAPGLRRRRGALADPGPRGGPGSAGLQPLRGRRAQRRADRLRRRHRLAHPQRRLRPCHAGRPRQRGGARGHGPGGAALRHPAGQHQVPPAQGADHLAQLRRHEPVLRLPHRQARRPSLGRGADPVSLHGRHPALVHPPRGRRGPCLGDRHDRCGQDRAAGVSARADAALPRAPRHPRQGPGPQARGARPRRRVPEPQERRAHRLQPVRAALQRAACELPARPGAPARRRGLGRQGLARGRGRDQGPLRGERRAPPPRLPGALPRPDRGRRRGRAAAPLGGGGASRLGLRQPRGSPPTRAPERLRRDRVPRPPGSAHPDHLLSALPHRAADRRHPVRALDRRVLAAARRPLLRGLRARQAQDHPQEGRHRHHQHPEPERRPRLRRSPRRCWSRPRPRSSCPTSTPTRTTTATASSSPRRSGTCCARSPRAPASSS